MKTFQVKLLILSVLVCASNLALASKADKKAEKAAKAAKLKAFKAERAEETEAALVTQAQSNTHRNQQHDEYIRGLERQRDAAQAMLDQTNRMRESLAAPMAGIRGMLAAIQSAQKAFSAEETEQTQGKTFLTTEEEKQLASRSSICAFCSIPSTSLLGCSKCRTVKYCSPRCQKDDWKIHKGNCKPRSDSEIAADVLMKKLNAIMPNKQVSDQIIAEGDQLLADLDAQGIEL